MGLWGILSWKEGGGFDICSQETGREWGLDPMRGGGVTQPAPEGKPHSLSQCQELQGEAAWSDSQALYD